MAPPSQIRFFWVTLLGFLLINITEIAGAVEEADYKESEGKRIGRWSQQISGPIYGPPPSGTVWRPIPPPSPSPHWSYPPSNPWPSSRPSYPSPGPSYYPSPRPSYYPSPRPSYYPPSRPSPRHPSWTSSPHVHGSRPGTVDNSFGASNQVSSWIKPNSDCGWWCHLLGNPTTPAPTTTSTANPTPAPHHHWTPSPSCTTLLCPLPPRSSPSSIASPSGTAHHSSSPHGILNIIGSTLNGMFGHQN